MFNITVLYNGKTDSIVLDKKNRISEILSQNEIFLMQPCGGHGKCGKCRVKASGMLSVPSEAERKLLSEEDFRNGIRLACETYIIGDAIISAVGETGTVMTDGRLVNQVNFAPEVKVHCIKIPKASLEDQRSDSERLLDPFSGIASVSYNAISHLPSEIKKASGSLFVVTYRDKIVSVSAEKRRILSAAIDIGTTTIAAYLIDLENGNTIKTTSCLNPQGIYGADVVSRIDASVKYGVHELRKCVLTACETLVKEMLEEVGAKNDDLYLLRLVGNTVMMHLALGISPENIASSPFIPAFTETIEIPAEKLGLCFCNADVITGPCISGYIGADTTAAVTACGMNKTQGLSLLLDIGTNGEIVLGNKDGMVCCSAAAGPAFEGAHIRCGSGAISGAVSGFSADKQGNIMIKTIDDKEPLSICGSGLVDCVAFFLDNGIIDETGYFAEEDDQPFKERLFEFEDNMAFRVSDDGKVFITQKDIREVQLAKAAIAAGIEVLLKKANKNLNDIETVYLAGGFGNYIDTHNACRIGLIPASLEKKCVSVGNAAGIGAKACLIDNDLMRQCRRITKQIDYIELSSDSMFSDLFIENIGFE